MPEMVFGIKSYRPSGAISIKLKVKSPGILLVSARLQQFVPEFADDKILKYSSLGGMVL